MSPFTHLIFFLFPQNCSWRDEHSAPFSWHTRSQMDLSLPTPPITPLADHSDHNIASILDDDNSKQVEAGGGRNANSLFNGGKTNGGTTVISQVSGCRDASNVTFTSRTQCVESQDECDTFNWHYDIETSVNNNNVAVRTFPDIVVEASNRLLPYKPVDSLVDTRVEIRTKPATSAFGRLCGLLSRFCIMDNRHIAGHSYSTTALELKSPSSGKKIVTDSQDKIVTSPTTTQPSITATSQVSFDSEQNVNIEKHLYHVSSISSNDDNRNVNKFTNITEPSHSKFEHNLKNNLNSVIHEDVKIKKRQAPEPMAIKPSKQQKNLISEIQHYQKALKTNDNSPVGPQNYQKLFNNINENDVEPMSETEDELFDRGYPSVSAKTVTPEKNLNIESVPILDFSSTKEVSNNY